MRAGVGYPCVLGPLIVALLASRILVLKFYRFLIALDQRLITISDPTMGRVKGVCQGNL